LHKETFDRLAALPRLSREKENGAMCKICDGRAVFFDIVDFNKCCNGEDVYLFGQSHITVEYFQCEFCGFLFTKFFDDWTTEEFSRFVYNEDYIKVDGEYAGERPERLAATVAERLDGLTGLRILDYGSGSGLLEGHLRSRGFANVVSYDPFASPRRPEGRFDVVTCFEVLEHTTAPHTMIADIAGLLVPGGIVLFTTGVQPPDMGRIRANWWYVAPRNGHASIHTLKSLSLAGQATGLTLHAGPGGLAFAGPAALPAFARLLSSIGRACRFFDLMAPDRDAAPSDDLKACWHGVEGAGATAWRWTRAAEITWRLQEHKLPPCDLTVTIALRNEVQRGFADGCKVMIGNAAAALVREAGNLKATLTLSEPADPIVRLVTPPPLRPCDLRDTADRRPLGLAIAVGPGVAAG
jgi:2-polyprenyl-6-hydroxyphenyl methylase/3-demethylubiquinone-9 3-methyltransferase